MANILFLCLLFQYAGGDEKLTFTEFCELVNETDLRSKFTFDFF